MTTTMIETTYDTRELDSPVGSLTLVASDAGLRAILWPGDDLGRTGLAGANLAPGRNDVLDEAAAQLEEYFARVRTSFDLPLDLQGTPFQVAAWEALATIPYRETRTYAEQAARLGRPNAVRAIGAANGRNPISIVLPCHRVVGSDGSLTGFAGGLETKAALLAFEHAHASRTTG
jgi:methylated-DNA-[protein]-cysteine S-methyltransferase